MLGGNSLVQPEPLNLAEFLRSTEQPSGNFCVHRLHHDHVISPGQQLCIQGARPVGAQIKTQLPHRIYRVSCSRIARPSMCPS